MLTRSLKASLCTKNEYRKYVRAVSGLPPTYASDSKIYGTGIFVAKAVKKGAYVIEYTGNRRSAQAVRTLHNALDRRGYQPNKLVTVNPGDINPDDLSVLDPRQRGKLVKPINHSCEPNCELVKVTFGSKEVVMVRALTAIHAHDEVTASYGFKTAATNHPIICNCKEVNCEGHI